MPVFKTPETPKGSKMLLVTSDVFLDHRGTQTRGVNARQSEKDARQPEDVRQPKEEGCQAHG